MSEDQPEVVSTGLTARVADSYGANPHEHKPSQDPFAPDVDTELAEAKQAATGGVEVDDETAEKASEPWDGTSSSTSETATESSPPKKATSSSRRAPSAASRSGQGPKGSSTARSTGTSSSE